jgi:hypothetical protein
MRTERSERTSVKRPVSPRVAKSPDALTSDSLLRARERVRAALVVVDGGLRDLDAQLADVDFFVHVLSLRAEHPPIPARADIVREELARAAPVLARAASLVDPKVTDALKGRARDLYEAVIDLEAIRDRLWPLVNAFNNELVSGDDYKRYLKIPSLKLAIAPKGWPLSAWPNVTRNDKEVRHVAP